MRNKIKIYTPKLITESMSNFVKKIGEKDLLLRALFETNPNLIYVKNEDLTFAFCNVPVLNFYGIDNEKEIIGKKIEEIIQLDEDIEISNEIDLCVLKNNSKITLEECCTDILGNKHYFKTSKICFIDEKNNQKYLLVISNDITDTKEKEQLFRQSHDFFTSFLDAIPASVFLMGENAQYIYINKQAREVFNINSNHYFRKTGLDIFEDKEMAKSIHLDNLETIISGASKEVIEIIKINNEDRKLATIKMPFVMANKKYLITMKFMDLDNEIQEFHDVLLTDMEKQMFFSMTTFISGITHEFRTPLQSIKGGLELLIAKNKLKNNEDNPETKLINTMLSATENIVGIVNNLMHFGMAKGHYQDGEDIYKTIVQDRKRVNVNDLIEETLEVIKMATLFKEHMQNGQINIIGDKNIECLVSNYILRNILINLINNSIKAIVVRAKMEPELKDRIINIRYSIVQEDILIEVEDNGIGIQREMATKLFSPFFRVNREIPGIGIGLFISKFWATSALMNLNLKESQYGKTVFTIKFKKCLEEI